MNLIFRVSQLGGFVEDIWFLIKNTILVYFANIFYGIFLGISAILDVVQNLFRKLAGLDSYQIDGEAGETTGDVILSIINSQTIMNIFYSLLILGIVLLFISTFVAVIKSEYEPMEKKNSNGKGKIIGKALKALMNFAVVPAVAVFGLWIGNALLGSLDMATAGTGDTTLSSRIFVVSTYDANRLREGGASYDEDFYDLVVGTGSGTGVNNFGIFVEGNSGVLNYTVADKVDQAFMNQTTITNPNDHFDQSTDFLIDVVYDLLDGAPTYSTSLTFSIYSLRLVWYYYDLTAFNFIIGIGVSLMLIVILAQVLLGLVKRLYALTMLFVISPPIVALTPINEDIYKNWKKEFIKQAISSYAVVVTMNIFIILIPVLTSINFFPVSSTASEATTVLVGFQNLLAQMLIILGGAVFFKDFSKMIAAMIGSEDALDVGAGKSEAYTKALGKSAVVGAGVLGAGIGLGTAPFKGLAAGTRAVGAGAKAIKTGVSNMSKNYSNLREAGVSKWQAATMAASLPLQNAAMKGFKTLQSIAAPKDANGNPMGFFKGNSKRIKTAVKGGKDMFEKFAKYNPSSNALGLAKFYKNFTEPFSAKEEKGKKVQALETEATRHKETMAGLDRLNKNTAPNKGLNGMTKNSGEDPTDSEKIKAAIQFSSGEVGRLDELMKTETDKAKQNSLNRERGEREEDIKGLEELKRYLIDNPSVSVEDLKGSRVDTGSALSTEEKMHINKLIESARTVEKISEKIDDLSKKQRK